MSMLSQANDFRFLLDSLQGQGMELSSACVRELTKIEHKIHLLLLKKQQEIASNNTLFEDLSMTGNTCHGVRFVRSLEKKKRLYRLNY